MWGLSQTEIGLSGDMPYQLFLSGTNLFTANSIYISFFVDAGVPVGKEYLVTLCLGEASGVVTNSIVTNLPRFDYRSEPKCYSKSIAGAPTIWYIYCESVNSFF